MAILRTYMINVYGKLVMAGKYTLDETEVSEGVKLVPELYQERVAQWLAERLA